MPPASYVPRVAFGWKVTHYDPALLTDEGWLPSPDGWISIDDVGAKFGGTVLTQDEFARVESLHLDAVRLFLGNSSIASLEVSDVEPRGDRPPLRTGQLLAPEEVVGVVKGMLREQGDWCRLESSDPAFYVHVGYDFYLYIGSASPCREAQQAVRDSGLFVEARLSPYHRIWDGDDNDHVLARAWAEVVESNTRTD